MQSLKKAGGILLILIGFLALVTPLTPGAWLIFVGLEIIGIRLALWDKIRNKLQAWADCRHGLHPDDTKHSDTEGRPHQ